MLNPFQVQALVFQLAVLEDLTPDTVGQRIRRENIELYKLINKQIDQAATKARDEWANAYGPLAQEYLKLHYAELSLRGDLMHALSQLPHKDPRDIRDVLITCRQLGEREEWGAAGEPGDMRRGIDMLRAADVDVADFEARLLALYPVATATPDDDPE